MSGAPRHHQRRRNQKETLTNIREAIEGYLEAFPEEQGIKQDWFYNLLKNGYVKIPSPKYTVGRIMSRSNVLLTDKDRTLLLKVSSLLEEIIETLDILEDKDTMKSIKAAEEDIKAGRIRSYKDFLKELKKSGKI